MEAKIIKKDELTVSAQFVIDGEEWQKFLDRAYEKNKARFKVAGFRQGHAPRKVVEKNYGADVFFEDAVNLNFGSVYADFLKQNKEIDAYGYPEIAFDKVDGTQFICTVKIARMPKVESFNYKGLKAERKVKAVSASDVDSELNSMQEKLARLETVSAAAKIGSIVNIDFKGFINKKPFAGGEAKGFDLTLGSKSFIPGFEDQLVGLKAQDKKNVEVTFPADYHAKEYAGKASVFEVVVNDVKEKKLPKLDDSFAKDASEFDTLEALKKDITEKIKTRYEKAAEIEYENALIEKVISTGKFKIAPQVIKEEADFMIEDINHRLAHQGLTLDVYCAYLGTTPEVFKESKIAEAEKVVKMRLVFDEIIKAQKLTAEETDCLEIVKNNNPTANMDDKKAKEYFGKLSQDKQNAIKNEAITKKLMDFLKKNNG